MGRKSKTTQQMKTLLYEKFMSGSTVMELASEYQVSRNTIKNYLKDMGIWDKKDVIKVNLDNKEVQEILNSSLSATEMAKELGCSLDTVRRKKLALKGMKDIPKKKREYYTEREVTGGKLEIKEYKISKYTYKGKRYDDITEIIGNLNDIQAL